jgi:hypothetical protein
MLGTYKICVDEKQVYQRNIITNSGRLAILNSLYGLQTGFAESIVVGIGTTAATVNDTSLVFEVGGSDVAMRIIDPVNEKLYLKGVLPASDHYEVNELGCSKTNLITAQQQGSQRGALLINFNSFTPWIDLNGTHSIVTTNSKLGVDSISYSITASATVDGYVTTGLDLSLLKNNTIFSFAYFASNLADLKIRMKTDDSNYYEYDGLSVTNGYRIDSFARSSFVATGTPDWANITSIAIFATATGSAGTLTMDGLRYDTPSGIDNGLLSRAVLSSPIIKANGVTMDIEYILELS